MSAGRRQPLRVRGFPMEINAHPPPLTQGRQIRRTCGCGRRDGKPVPYDGKPAGFGLMTWFCVSKIVGPVGLEKMVICDRSRCRGAHCASAPGRLRPGKRDLCKIVQTLSVCPKGRQLSQRESQIRRTCGTDGGPGNPAPTDAWWGSRRGSRVIRPDDLPCRSQTKSARLQRRLVCEMPIQSRSAPEKPSYCL